MVLTTCSFLPLKTSIQDFAIKASRFVIYNVGVYDYIDKNGSMLLKLSIAPSASILVDSIPYLRSLVGLKLYDNSGEQDGSMMRCWILYSGISGLTATTA